MLDYLAQSLFRSRNIVLPQLICHTLFKPVGDLPFMNGNRGGVDRERSKWERGEGNGRKGRRKNCGEYVK